MYEINIENEENYINSYIYRSKNEYNQKMMLNIWLDSQASAKRNFWTVTLHIGKVSNRNKDFEEIHITGKDGIKSLIWAKKCLVHFINNIYNLSINYSTRENIFIVRGSDKRRFEVYKYGLRDLEFEEKVIYGEKVLWMKIN